MPAKLRPLLVECSALYSLLLPYALEPPSATPSARSLADPIPPAPPPGFPGATVAPQQKGGACKASGTHVYTPDPRNADILVGMRDGVSGKFELVWRPAAKVSVLDSGFMLGDGVWEGIRLHNGVLAFDRVRRPLQPAQSVVLVQKQDKPSQCNAVLAVFALNRSSKIGCQIVERSN